MDRRAVLRAFDEQMRRRPEPDGSLERDGPVLRSMSPGWSGVIWTDLDAAGADAALAAQVRYFAAAGLAWEWKHYSYDEPADLPARLLAAGATAEPAETLLVADLHELTLAAPPPPGVEVREVVDDAEVRDLVAVHDAVFGGDHSAIGATVLGSDTVTGVVAVAGGVPVSAGRVELPPGCDFAGLWGGGTLPAWRGRGLFRALVAHRAAVATARGYRYLQVDATADSAPILRRLGFVELAITTPYTWPAALLG